MLSKEPTEKILPGRVPDFPGEKPIAIASPQEILYFASFSSLPT